MSPVELLILGAGSRGRIYAEYAARHPDEARVVGVAEPRGTQRRALGELFGLPASAVFQDWREALARPKFADAVIIATQDADHVAPVEQAAALGYDICWRSP